MSNHPSSNWDSSERPQKAQAREYALLDVGRRKNSLWLPGNRALCVSKARETGVLAPESRIAFVERNPEVFRQSQTEIDRFDWKTQPVGIRDELHNVVLPFDLDYAFIDLNGTLESRMALWMATHLSRKIRDGATLCVSHTYGLRNNQFFKRVAMKLKDGYMSQFEELKKQVRIKEDLLVGPMAMLKSIFNGHDFTLAWPLVYKDNVRCMILFRMDDFRSVDEGNNGWPSLTELLGVNPVLPVEEEQKVASPNSARAKKAWATRKANEAKPKTPVKKAKPIQAGSVVDALSTGRRGANKLFDSYVEQRVAEGMEERRVRAAIKAHVTRRELATT